MCKSARLAMTAKSRKWFLAGFTVLFGMTLLLPIATRASPGDTLFVQSKSGNVYQAPSTDAPVVMQVDQDQKLKEFRRQGGWVKVIIYGEVGKEGWIEESLIGPKPVADTTAEIRDIESDTIVGAIETPKPEARPLLHNFLLKITGTMGRIKGHCRFITGSGATKRFKIGPLPRPSYKIKAQAIRCSIKSASGFAGRRMGVKLWGDGELLVSKTYRNVHRVTFFTPWDWN